MTRRELLKTSLFGLSAMAIPLPLRTPRHRSASIAVITDLHHGLAPDAQLRLEAFAKAVRTRRHLDVVMQMGDFCYSDGASDPVVQLFDSLPHPKVHVLGNHDMDKCDKATAMRKWSMPARYGTYQAGGYRLIVLDLNHFQKDGTLHAYANGNYYVDGATHNLADPEQLAWLEQELSHGDQPTILVSHQPLGFAEPNQPLPSEQVEVLDVVLRCRSVNPRGAVCACLFGHLHVDRLEFFHDIPCLCLNSASYFWGGGMFPYRDPLFAFLEFTGDGFLRVEGRQSEFLKPPPTSTDTVVGRAAALSNRQIMLSDRTSFI